MLKKLNSTIKKKKKNEDLYIYLTKEDIQMSHKQLKRCSTSYAIRELKMKITSYHYMPIRLIKIYNTDIIQFWPRCEAIRALIHCWWECKMVQPPQNSLTVSHKVKYCVRIWSNNHIPTYLYKWIENLHLHKKPPHKSL